MRAFGMSTMRYCGTSFVQVALASLLGSLAAFGLNAGVLAAGACIEGPNLAAQGRHWYYRVDRTNHRKCWFVMETGLKTHENAPLETASVPTSPPNSTLFSWFTSGSASAGMQRRILSAAPRGTVKVVRAVPNARPARSTLAGMQPSTTKERLPPATPRRTVKIVHGVPNERSRPAAPPEAKGTATVERNQPFPSRSSAEHAEQVNSPPPDQAAQDALFLEFLRWKELQKSVK
jgi:hypothetical protein